VRVVSGTTEYVGTLAIAMATVKSALRRRRKLIPSSTTLPPNYPVDVPGEPIAATIRLRGAENWLTQKTERHTSPTLVAWSEHIGIGRSSTSFISDQ
jgi:hypothetical protein